MKKIQLQIRLWWIDSSNIKSKIVIGHSLTKEVKLAFNNRVWLFEPSCHFVSNNIFETQHVASIRNEFDFKSKFIFMSVNFYFRLCCLCSQLQDHNYWQPKILYYTCLYTSPVSSESFFIQIWPGRGLTADLWVWKPSCYQLCQPCLLNLRFFVGRIKLRTCSPTLVTTNYPCSLFSGFWKNQLNSNLVEAITTWKMCEFVLGVTSHNCT